MNLVDVAQSSVAAAVVAVVVDSMQVGAAVPAAMEWVAVAVVVLECHLWSR